MLLISKSDIMVGTLETHCPTVLYYLVLFSVVFLVFAKF